MSDVVILVDDLGPSRAEAASMLSKELSLSISEIMRYVGTEAPVIRRKIFDRCDPASAPKLASVMRRLDEFECHWRAFEVADGQEWNPSGKFFPLNLEIVNNMIEDWGKSLEQQRYLGSLENGD